MWSSCITDGYWNCYSHADREDISLTQEMLSRMLSRRLEVDHECEMAYELLRAVDEQTLLTAFYIGVFEDNQVENDQKDESFSQGSSTVQQTSHHKRKRDMLMRKCATLNGNCQKFNVIYKRLKRLSKSGENEVDFMTRVGQRAWTSQKKQLAQDGGLWALLRPCSS
ncbi:hypothetical protein Tco_0983632 [Tanacetum coccineum]